MTIADNDAPGTIQFSAATYSVWRERRAGHRARDAHRHEPGQRDHRAVHDDQRHRDGPAPTTPTCRGRSRSPRSRPSRTWRSPILDDSLPEGNETVVLTLSNPSTGATLGAIKTAVLTILDDEQTLQFSAPVYVVNEARATATVTVVRTGPDGRHA